MLVCSSLTTQKYIPILLNLCLLQTESGGEKVLAPVPQRGDNQLKLAQVARRRLLIQVARSLGQIQDE